MTFRLFCVKFRIDYSLFLLISLALISGYNSLLYLLLFSSLHEAGHIIALLLMRGKPDEITLSYYGIGLKHSTKLSSLKETFFLLSGILVNLLFCFFNVCFDINFALAFVNALPLYPLDGGRVLRIIINCIFAADVSEKVFIAVTAVMLILLTVTGIVLRNLSLILISMYVIFYSINFKRYI